MDVVLNYLGGSWTFSQHVFSNAHIPSTLLLLMILLCLMATNYQSVSYSENVLFCLMNFLYVKIKVASSSQLQDSSRPLVAVECGAAVCSAVVSNKH